MPKKPKKPWFTKPKKMVGRKDRMMYMRGKGDPWCTVIERVMDAGQNKIDVDGNYMTRDEAYVLATRLMLWSTTGMLEAERDYDIPGIIPCPKLKKNT